MEDKFDTIAFDIEGYEFTHEGAFCTFEVILKRFESQRDAPVRLARVIWADDTNQIDSIPKAADLLGISIRRSELYRDNNTQPSTEITLYDMLYLWAQDRLHENFE